MTSIPSKTLLSTVFLAAALTACGGDDDGTPATNVATDKGTVIGVETATMIAFRGIPYAAPPVGALRWKPPQPATAWSGGRDASSFAAHCAQPASPFGAASSAEDCLYLNVYLPKAQRPFPVMLWIHGGALLTGESDDYDPSALVAQGVAVVTINYRLGALGFLTHPALSSEGGGASGNYGLMDQQAAMQWVRANISAFGGDPTNVTVFGESAGGLSTHSQIVSPLAAGLFQKAIVESGSYSLTPPTLAVAEGLGQNLAAATGCTAQTASCLRAVSVASLIANESAIQFGGTTLPTVDGKVLTKTYADAFTSGTFNKVPMLEGTNQHEYSLLSAVTIDPVLGHPIGASDYPVQINALFGAITGAAVRSVYPLNSAETPAQTFDDVLTDAVFTCNARKVAKLVSAQGVPYYAYEFADPRAPMVFAIPPRPEGYGAYHAAEIQYLFPSTQPIVSGAPFTSAQADLAASMVRFWTTFAKTGNPNPSGSTSVWPAYTAVNDTYLTLAPGAIATTTQVSTRHNCGGFWTPGV